MLHACHDYIIIYNHILLLKFFIDSLTQKPLAGSSPPLLSALKSLETYNHQRSQTQSPKSHLFDVRKSQPSNCPKPPKIHRSRSYHPLPRWKVAGTCDRETLNKVCLGGSTVFICLGRATLSLAFTYISGFLKKCLTYCYPLGFCGDLMHFAFQKQLLQLGPPLYSLLRNVYMLGMLHQPHRTPFGPFGPMKPPLVLVTIVKYGDHLWYFAVIPWKHFWQLSNIRNYYSR